MSNQLNLKWGAGIYMTRSGHLRYHSPKSMRGEYVHRKMVADMIAETPYSIKLLLPYPFEVHHADFNKVHNCGCNFIVLSTSFHSAMTVEHTNAIKRRFQAKWRAASQWGLFEEQLTSEVPF